MFKHIGSTWILNALQLAVVLVLSPFVVRSLGDDVNGVWVTIVAFTGVLSLLILGVPMASVRFIAERVAKRDAQGVNAAIATCLGICLTLGAATLLVGLALYAVFETKYLQGTLGRGLAPETLVAARWAFVLVVVQVAFGFALRLPYGIFDAHHDFVQRNLIMGGEALLRFALTLALLSWRAELWVLAVVQITCMLGEFVVAFVWVKRRHPELRFSLVAFDRAMVRQILGFSVFAMLLNVGALLAFRIDALVIGAYLPPIEATYFDFGNKFFDPLTGVLIAISAVVMPTTTRLSVQGDTRALVDVFLKWSKISLSIVMLIGLYLLILGPEFLGAWMASPVYHDRSGPVLQLLMLSFFFYLPVRGVALPILMGLGKPKAPALGLLAAGALNLGISLALVKPLSILGVALGTAIPNILFSWYILRLACRELGVPMSRYLQYVAGRTLIGALAPAAVLVFIKLFLQPASMPAVLVAGVVMTLVFALTWVLYVYRDDSYLDLRGELSRLGGRA